MKKNVFGRQFKRDINERKALFKGLMSSLVLRERIQTTEEKAKSIKGSVEKLVTKAKVKGTAATPFLLPYLHEDAAKRMISDIAPRFTNRPGGYTRIVRLGKRFGDDATVVILEWVEKNEKLKVQSSKLKKVKTAEVESSVNIEEIKKETSKSKTATKTVKKENASAGSAQKKTETKKKEKSK